VGKRLRRRDNESVDEHRRALPWKIATISLWTLYLLAAIAAVAGLLVL
jgi:hypothetical protein